MYREHADFQLPDLDSTIWRCLTLEKFTDLLETHEVFFSRADIPPYQREGAWSMPEIRYLLESRGVRESRFDEMIGMTERISDEACKSVALNCWCIGEQTRSHMWENYLDGNDGVAIATTVNDLINAFDRETVQPTYIGEVKYINYGIDRMNAKTSLAPFVFKGSEFESERELRAVTTALTPNPDLELNGSEPDFYPGSTINGNGIRVPVHLDKLIKQIQVAPSAGKRCVELVRAYSLEFLGIRVQVA